MMKSLTELINDMISVRVALGYAPKTYQTFSRDFGHFLNCRYPSATALTEDMVLEWAEIREGESPTGHSTRICRVRLFGQYLSSIGQDAYILPTGISSRKTTFIPHIFTDDELRNLFFAADNLVPKKIAPQRHIQLPVLLRLLYYCGLRPGEGRCLKLDDVDLENRLITVGFNKLHQSRTIPISKDMQTILQEYLDAADVFIRNSTYVFPSSDGSPHPYGWLKRNFKQIWLSAYPDSISMVRAYDLRHRYASAILMEWIDAGIDIRAKLPYLSSYMGHAELSETLYYVHMLPENLRNSTGIHLSRFEALLPEVEDDEQ